MIAGEGAETTTIAGFIAERKGFNGAVPVRARKLIMAVIRG